MVWLQKSRFQQQPGGMMWWDIPSSNLFLQVLCLWLAVNKDSDPVWLRAMFIEASIWQRSIHLLLEMSPKPSGSRDSDNKLTRNWHATVEFLAKVDNNGRGNMATLVNKRRKFCISNRLPAAANQSVQSITVVLLSNRWWKSCCKHLSALDPQN